MKLPEAARARCESLVIEKTVRLFPFAASSQLGNPAGSTVPALAKKKEKHGRVAWATAQVTKNTSWAGDDWRHQCTTSRGQRGCLWHQILAYMRIYTWHEFDDSASSVRRSWDLASQRTPRGPMMSHVFSGFLQSLFGICNILSSVAHVEEDQFISVLRQSMTDHALMTPDTTRHHRKTSNIQLNMEVFLLLWNSCNISCLISNACYKYDSAGQDILGAFPTRFTLDPRSSWCLIHNHHFNHIHTDSNIMSHSSPWFRWLLPWCHPCHDVFPTPWSRCLVSSPGDSVTHWGHWKVHPSSPSSSSKIQLAGKLRSPVGLFTGLLFGHLDRKSKVNGMCCRFLTVSWGCFAIEACIALLNFFWP